MENKLNQLKAAIIGAAGRVAYQFELELLRPKPASHYGAYRENEQVNLVAVSDIDFKGIMFHENMYPDYASMMNREKPDIVSVCTPPETHHSIVVDLAIKYKPKIIFCEKPLASTVEEAYSMVAACKDNDVSLAVNYTRRWMTVYRRVKHLLEDNEVIEIIGVTNGETNGKVQTHMLDLFNWYRQKNTDLHYVQLPHEHYLIFEIHIFTDKAKFSIIDNGNCYLMGNAHESIHYCDRQGKPIIEIQTAPLYSALSNIPTPIAKAVSNIVDHLRHNAPLYCTGENGIKALTLAKELNLGEIV